MAGTDGPAVGARGAEDRAAGAVADGAADDDALSVLTAVLLTPGRFPGVLGDDYPQACAALGLEPTRGGYGLLFGQDGGGARWTVVVDDVPLVATAVASWDCGMEYDLSPDERSMVVALPGWPLSVAVKAPGLPAPHDPDPQEAGPALVPPDTTVWGPAQRRLGADEIAAHWAHWRTQLGDADFAAAPEAAGAGAGAAPAAPAGAGRPAGGGPAHPGVRRVLGEARAYLGSPPPPGRVRTFFADGDARTVRADGPGWSLVARTDDIAFLLLDDGPGEIIPVGRGPELPALLEGLAGLAVDPV
ncbi:hypothetical protein [Streptomyces sp. MJP52]|uniref:hypothetical protein n=1 Tax=Streptomyces sp. MJP52 TaxID=2940555 RepID=UPI0024731EA1|nr:hypothetical protein [Streptomyces sp. MJP52]MDH6228247.1 hypothetical protein [Streptomyces sp. MJP52]